MTPTICASAPVRLGCDRVPVLGTDFVLALLRSMAAVAATAADAPAFAEAITIEADALQLRVTECIDAAAH